MKRAALYMRVSTKNHGQTTETQALPLREYAAHRGFEIVAEYRDEGISGSIAEQTEQIFANMRAILEAAGSSLDRLVKTTVFLVDLNEFAAMNEVYARHVGDAPPARSTVEIAALPSGAKVEIDAIAEI